jgi:hypothetical protein
MSTISVPGERCFFGLRILSKTEIFRKLSLSVILSLMGSKTRSLNAGEFAKKFYTVNIKEMISWNNEQGVEKAIQYIMYLKRNCNFFKKLLFCNKSL